VPVRAVRIVERIYRVIFLSFFPSFCYSVAFFFAVLSFIGLILRKSIGNRLIQYCASLLLLVSFTSWSGHVDVDVVLCLPRTHDQMKKEKTGPVINFESLAVTDLF